MSIQLTLSFYIRISIFLTIVSIQLQSELLAENANLKLKIQTLERQKEELEEVNIVIIYLNKILNICMIIIVQ